MKKLKLEQLKPGMRVSETVYNSSGRMLITAGLCLTSTWIERLGEQDISFVEVEDGLLDSINLIPDDILEKEALETRKYFNDTIKLLVHEGRVNIEPIHTLINELVGELLLKRSVLSCLYLLRTTNAYLYRQSVTVCILALLMGIHLRYDRSQLIELGVGALLHDLGMLSVSEDILNKSEVLNEEEWSQITEHSDAGFKILKGFDDISVLSKHVSLHHHERWNGSGYPNGLKGYEIQEYARIVAVADVFLSLMADRPYREAYTFDEAVEFLTTMSGYYFDSKAVEAFTASIIIYPVGSMVLLNTGEIGRIIGVNPQVPTRPSIQMIIRSAAASTRYDDFIDMYKYPELTVVRKLNNTERVSVENKVHIQDNGV